MIDKGTMRAVKITAHGGSEVLEVGAVARPTVSGSSVLVRVRAAALNRADVLQRMGHYPAPPGVAADIPGLEFAGEVEMVGNEVQRWKMGQRVFGIAAGGAQAEYIAVAEDHLAEIPVALDWTEAAAIPEAFITAHDALFTQGELTIGERVGIHAVGSGVGLAAVQLARAAGAQTMGTARTESKLDAAQEFGLDEGVLVSEDSQAFVAAVCEWTRDAGIHIILDLVGASLFQANLEALAPRGRLLLVGSLGGSRAEMDWGIVMRKRLRLMGTVLRARSREEKARAVRLFAAQVVPLLERQTVRPVIDSVFDLTDVRRAHERMESNESFGKIVLRIE
jgi:putative PIG3 family NAD(P)H quinone oxidoreductase